MKSLMVLIWLPFGIPLIGIGILARLASSSVVYGWEVADEVIDSIAWENL